jgi:hypothetical protein
MQGDLELNEFPQNLEDSGLLIVGGDEDGDVHVRMDSDALWRVARGLSEQTSSIDAVFGESTVFSKVKTVLQIHAHTNMVGDETHTLSDLRARTGVVFWQGDFSVFFAQSGYFT